MRIAVGMSGGVDSSVSALLLKEQGHNVIGVTLRFHKEEVCEGINVCCSPQDVRDAVRVSEILGIPHITLSWEDIFGERVINYFISESLKGKTPNACAICNRDVKTAFLALYLNKVADIDRLATGHYILKEETKEYGTVLKRPKDRKKDQTYFMALIPSKIVPMLEFPLGNMTKDEVRKIAEDYKLPVSDKRESQELCFLMGKSPGKFLEEKVGNRKGKIVHISGKTLGEHRGLFHYTIGQRRGLGISWKAPLYVVDIDPETNTLFVAEEEFLYGNRLFVKDINFIVPKGKWNNVQAQIRYRSKPAPVKDIKEKDEGYEVIFGEKVRGITPGQIVAFYDGDILLGGAVIEREDYLA